MMSEEFKKRLSRRKFVALTGSILAGSAILAACGDSTPTASTAATTAASGSATTAAAGATTAAGSVVTAPDVFGIKLKDLDSGGTLKGQYSGKKVVFVTADGDLATALKEVVPYFQKASGATVEIQTFPGETFMEKVQL